jgi:2-hydroxychromene-2-carboxylate isomerase
VLKIVQSSPERKTYLPHLAALASAHNASTSKTPTLSPLATAHRTASSPGPFLKKFVAKVSLDEDLYEKLKNAGFDEDTLRHFAGLGTEKIDNSLKRHFPR